MEKHSIIKLQHSIICYINQGEINQKLPHIISSQISEVASTIGRIGKCFHFKISFTTQRQSEGIVLDDIFVR